VGGWVGGWVGVEVLCDFTFTVQVGHDSGCCRALLVAHVPFCEA
jgi:hypothetical protein